MTQLLKDAFAEAEKLPREEQDAFARWLLEELASEKPWSDCLPPLKTNWQNSLPRRLKRIAQVGRSLSILIYCEVPHHLEL
jgi:hypothetical protein